MNRPVQILDQTASKQAQDFRADAERAEIREEPALAVYYRNLAWLLENGHEWLDDVAVREGVGHEIA